MPGDYHDIHGSYRWLQTARKTEREKSEVDPLRGWVHSRLSYRTIHWCSQFYGYAGLTYPAKTIEPLLPPVITHVNRLCVLEVGLLLELLLEEGVGLGLLDADAAGAEAAEVAGRVGLVHAGAQLLVEGDQRHTCADSDRVTR